ncbi:MAG: hypothetical protein HXX08_04345 [Chloroflexi bacterium]|uniref:Mannosylglycerate hydrolase MGH1-like glycoside hydrolase domain-containing protein n=1 Tax=Candidatus Chlorohelix allophototropha TaxID=3003348 RepID=A0A8T7M0V5_9CHLR|nr:hypothetical protein [Chloroflexota bacterium]WJW66971.1 hypothetical protein OZ401_000217 [Chloroflexota bacterium L227-S17]
MFPQDEYTPHGYLDNPAHAWKIPGPGGVLRSRPAIGMGWHYPSYAAAYNRKFVYTCHLQIGLALEDGTILLDSSDFKRGGVRLKSSYHSKNIMRFDFQVGEISGSAGFYVGDPAGGNALLCDFSIRNLSSVRRKIGVLALLDYERNLGQGFTWESGIYARSYENPDYAGENSRVLAGHTLGVYQEGTQFHLAVASLDSENALPVSNYTNLSDFEAVREALSKGKSATASSNPRISFSRIELDLPLSENGHSPAKRLLLAVGRGESEKQAIDIISPLLADNGHAAHEIAEHYRKEDGDFWGNAPKLGGDWSPYLRRGVIYDVETLRSLVRRPAGIYRYRWDAMQLQVPRVVLAEAALDMLILSYADPETAKEVLLGTFADSPEPNIPCSREDGSYNMIAADGTPCGTAPEWCFPFHCIDLVYLKTGDHKWLAQLYPYLEDYIGFWITQRLDTQGRPFYMCSWEAGQDNSPRFGIKDDPSGGGALTRHIYPVDLQAALAQACRLLAQWGVELGQDSSRWQALGDSFALATQRMFHNGWFHDFDTRQNRFTEVLDTMQLAPLLCRAATAEQVQALYPMLANPPKHGQVFHPLMWPSVAFCLIEACHQSGRADLAARHSWNIIAPVYRWLDSDPTNVDVDSGGLPGNAREYWTQVVAPNAEPPIGGGGAEVYGWGCLTSMLLFRYIIGFVEEAHGFRLTPNLPPELLQAGKTYRVSLLRCRNARVALSYTVADKLEIAFEIYCERAAAITIKDGSGTLLYDSPQAIYHTFRLILTNASSLDVSII